MSSPRTTSHTRVLIIGSNSAHLRTAEALVRAGICVDLVTAHTAPFGLLTTFGAISPARQPRGTSCPPGTTPRLRLVGNIPLSTATPTPAGAISPATVRQLARDHADIASALRDYGCAVTSWQAYCVPHTELTDWDELHDRAQKIPVCF